MKNRQFRLIDAAESGVGFARNLKRPPPRVNEAAKRLEEAVESARVAGQDQIRAKAFRKTPRYSVTRAKTILLRKHLGPIAADGIEMLAGLPGIRESLKLPRIKDAPEKHLEATKRVRRVAEDHEKEFIDERNYDENFLNSFDGAVRDVEGAAGVDKGVGRAKYTRATADVKEEMARLCIRCAGHQDGPGVSGRPEHTRTLARGEPSPGEDRPSPEAQDRPEAGRYQRLKDVIFRASATFIHVMRVFTRTFTLLLLVTSVASAQRPDSTRVRRRPIPKPKADSVVVPADTVKPPISPPRAFLYSAILPGSGQAILGRQKAAAIMLLIEGMAIAMIRQSAASVGEARRMSGDSLVVVSYVNSSGDSATATVPRRFDAAYVHTRQSQVEDWAAFLIANHLFSGADAFVAANLWELPAQLQVRVTPQGASVGAKLTW